MRDTWERNAGGSRALREPPATQAGAFTGTGRQKRLHPVGPEPLRMRLEQKVVSQGGNGAGRVLR